jgi:hypothetical protein
MTFRETVEKAADKAGLSTKNSVAANGYLLLAWCIVEHGQLKLPHGGLAILSQVSKERTGHAIPTGSLRWYRVQLIKEPEMVARVVSLPAGFDLLVRASQAA